jgi:quercetin dioxygenase-like cupin family protein
MPGYVTTIAEAEIEPGIAVARHTHPGIESSYILEGNIELPVEGQPTRTVTAGEAFQIHLTRRMLAANLLMLR